jgi:hypothetical protein
VRQIKKKYNKSSKTKNCSQPSTKPNTENYGKAVKNIHANNTQETNNIK